MADAIFSLKNKKIWVAGETGLVGQALLRRLSQIDCTVLSAPHSTLDLTDARSTAEWLKRNRPDAVFMAAAKVGGIGANAQYPADFLHDNLAIAQNVIHAAYQTGVERLLFLGSSCIYPKMAAQPIVEETLLSGPLEPTNEWYAIAKIAGLKMVQAYRRQFGCSYISAMPTNLYGPFDRFDAEKSHVIPAMVEKFHRAKMEGDNFVELWGTGAPLREFLHVDDLAEALIVLIECYDGEAPINIGSGDEISIRDLAAMMAEVTEYKKSIRFNVDRPDGTPRKLLDSTKMRQFGWSPVISLKEGLMETYRWYLEQVNPERRFSASSGM